MRFDKLEIKDEFIMFGDKYIKIPTFRVIIGVNQRGYEYEDRNCITYDGYDDFCEDNQEVEEVK